MRFVVIALPRTGSTHLMTVLGTHPEIVSHGEVFHPNRIFLRWPGWPESRPHQLEKELEALRQSDPVAFLDRIFEERFGRQHVGFKIFNNQNNEILERLIVDRSVAKIVLYRANALARYASALAARENRAWGPNKMQKTDRPLVLFRAQQFRKYHADQVAFYDRVLSRLHDLGQASLLIRYDELNNSRLLDRVAVFLGAAAGKFELGESFSARGAQSITARFKNPQAVQQFLEMQGWSNWAYESDLSFVPLIGPAESKSS